MATGAERRRDSDWSLKYIAVETWRGFRADRGYDLAGSLAFTSLLTAVPLLASFSLFLAALFRENDEQILSLINSVLPYQSARLARNLADFVAQASAISGVGLVLLVVASVRLVFVVEGVFNAVWGAPRRPFRLSRILRYTLALVSLGLILGGIGWGLRALRHAPMAAFLNSPAVAAAASFLLKALVLTLLYRYLPNARVRTGIAAVAGAAVALALELLRLGFMLYVEALRRMNLITGSLALVLFAVVSLYFVWALILLGVELTHVLQTASAESGPEGRREGAAEMAIRMLLQMSRGDARSVAQISAGDHAPPGRAVAILEALERAGLVRGDPVHGFELALSPRRITVGRVVEALSPDLFHVSPRRDRVAQCLEPIFLRLEGERRALLNATLAELEAK